MRTEALEAPGLRPCGTGILPVSHGRDPTARRRFVGQAAHATTSGFSMLEFLLVAGVISLLLGLLLPGLTAVSRLSRRVAARHETRMLAAAWNEYYNTYQQWPTNQIGTNETIAADLAAILQGLPAADTWNPHRLRFVEFSRFDRNGNPANPWDTPYHVRFDIEGVNTIPSPDNPSTNIPRSVIVWTYTDRDRLIGSWEE